MVSPICYDLITKYFASHKEIKNVDSIKIYNMLSFYTKPYICTTKDACDILHYIKELKRTDDFLININAEINN